MKNTNTIFLFLLFSTPCFSATEITNWLEKNKIDTYLEFGYQSNSGNTESRALNSSLKAVQSNGRFRNTGEVKISIAGEDGEEDKNQKKLKLQSDYKVDEKVYLYSNISGSSSKYSSYFVDISISPGVGYQWYNTETFTLETEVGVGYRYQEPNFDEIDDDDLILPENVNETVGRFNADVLWQINEHFSLEWETNITVGQSNSRYYNVFSATQQINDRFSIKIEKEIDYMDKVPYGLDNKDSELNINFSYKI